MRYFIIKSVVFFLLIFGCKKEETKPQQQSSISIQQRDNTSKEELIYIEGDNIWVRSKPKRGKVILKLSNGVVCTLQKKGDLDTIRGYIDNWYQIKYKDSIGWVFGSQTTLKSEDTKRTQLFLQQSNQFLEALISKDFKTLNSFILENEPVHCVLATSTNDYLRTTITNDLETTTEKFYDIKDLLNYISKIYTSESKISYLNLLENEYAREPYSITTFGVFYERLYDGNNYISNYEKWQIKYDMMVTDSAEQMKNEHLKYVEREKETQFRLIVALVTPTDDDPLYQFYFYFRQGKWYLSGIYHPLHN